MSGKSPRTHQAVGDVVTQIDLYAYWDKEGWQAPYVCSAGSLCSNCKQTLAPLTVARHRQWIEKRNRGISSARKKTAGVLCRNTLDLRSPLPKG